MNVVLLAVTAITSGLTVSGFLGRWGWVWELTSHFRAQYALTLTACAILLFMRQQPIGATIAGIGALVNLVTILPLYVKPTPSQSKGKVVVRALLLNLHCRNRAHRRVVDFVRAVDPDVVMFVEVTKTWMRQLSVLDEAYPFRVGIAHRRGWGMMLLSRLPFEQSQVLDRKKSGIPGVVACVSVGRERLTVIGAHPFAPVGRVYAASRNGQLEALARLSRSHPAPMVVLGDLNITSWSPHFQRLLRASGLRDSQRGHGVQPTWPVWCPPLCIPIDHCLVSPGVTVHRRRTGPAVGSDHSPLIVEFSVQSQ